VGGEIPNGRFKLAAQTLSSDWSTVGAVFTFQTVDLDLPPKLSTLDWSTLGAPFEFPARSISKRKFLNAI
jgi:hypothetical protein